MKMEQKLEEYRAKQQKLNRTNRFRDKLKNIFSYIFERKKNVKDGEQKENEDQFRKIVPSVKLSHPKKRKMDYSDEAKSLIITEDACSVDEESLSDDSIWCCSWLQLFYYFLYFLLWGLLYMIFINLQFGTVYLILSALILMYLNTGTTPKKSGEVSAYSVFNKDCISIDGTLKAEQFEREIMFGAGSVR